MLPRLYEASLDVSSYENNGYGFFRDCIKCEVTEELNGGYTLNMVIASTDRLANIVSENMIVKAKANAEDPPQLFEINKLVVKSNGEIEIQGQHIKYLLMQNCITSWYSMADIIVEGTPQQVADEILDSLMFETPFEFFSDIKTINTFNFEDSQSQKLGDIFGGSDYSLLSVFGGDYHYDNFKIELLENRGTDSGYKLRFGHTMSDYEQTITNDTEYTHLIGFAKVSRSDVENGTLVISGMPVLSNSKRVFPKVKQIDFTSDIRDYFGSSWKVDFKTGLHCQDTADKLFELTNKYLINNYNRKQAVGECNITITYNSELDKMQHLKLGDTVKVCFGEDKNSLFARISKVTYNSLAERYTLIEVGEQKPSLLDFILNKRR